MGDDETLGQHLISELGLLGQNLLFYFRLLWLWAWNKNVKLRWYRWRWSRGWIPKDEFHPSLNPDIGVMMVMNSQEIERYQQEISIQRQRAHDAGIQRLDQYSN